MTTEAPFNLPDAPITTRDGTCGAGFHGDPSGPAFSAPDEKGGAPVHAGRGLHGECPEAVRAADWGWREERQLRHPPGPGGASALAPGSVPWMHGSRLHNFNISRN